MASAVAGAPITAERWNQLQRIRRLAGAYFADPSEKENAARIADELRAALAEYHERFER